MYPKSATEYFYLDGKNLRLKQSIDRDAQDLAQVSLQVQNIKSITVRPRDTRPQATRTSTVHDFELGPKILEKHVF